MNFDVSVTHEPRFARVKVAGPAGLGRLLSLLQVLRVDSATWPHHALLLDLREVQPPLSDDEQSRLAAAVAQSLSALRRVAILTGPGATREAGGVRAFGDEAEARSWLESA